MNTNFYKQFPTFLYKSCVQIPKISINSFFVHQKNNNRIWWFLPFQSSFFILHFFAYQFQTRFISLKTFIFYNIKQSFYFAVIWFIHFFVLKTTFFYQKFFCAFKLHLLFLGASLLFMNKFRISIFFLDLNVLKQGKVNLICVNFLFFFYTFLLQLVIFIRHKKSIESLNIFC